MKKNNTKMMFLKLLTVSMFIMLAQSVMATCIKFWTTEIQPDRMAKQESLAKDFEKKTGNRVEIIPIDEKDIGMRATASFAANDLPDVIYHPLQYALPWAEAGILDTEINDEIVRELGLNTFSEGAVKMVTHDKKVVSVPLDGWTQMIVYRKDLFDAKKLKAPTTYKNIGKAIKVLHNPPNMFGFVAPNKIDENYMSQVLEHVFLANGVSPLNKKGFKKLAMKPTKEVLEFYKLIANSSPTGELYWKQARELFFAGKAAMIIWSPFILDELAGLRDSDPPTINDDPTSKELAKKTGFVTTFAGPSNSKGAAWADLRFLSVTADADIEVAKMFVEYSLSEGYMKNLQIAPEGKFPIRKGPTKGSDEFVTKWSKLPVGVNRKEPLSKTYSSDTIDKIVAGLSTANRWGVKEGQLSLASKINNSRIINKIVRKYIDGEIDVKKAISQLNNELSKIE